MDGWMDRVQLIPRPPMIKTAGFSERPSAVSGACSVVVGLDAVGAGSSAITKQPDLHELTTRVQTMCSASQQSNKMFKKSSVRETRGTGQKLKRWSNEAWWVAKDNSGGVVCTERREDDD